MQTLNRRNIVTSEQGFTLIELLVVVGILGILLAITIVALNPAKHFADARNAQRQSDVVTVLDGIYEYEASNAGKTPPGLANVATASKALGAQASQTATSTSFSTPNLTLTVPSGNVITTGSVTISGCSQAADNGTYTVTSGTTTTVVVNNSGASPTSATGCIISNWSLRIDLCADLVPNYMAAIPMDPTGSTGTQCASTYNTGYTILVNAAGNRYTVAAPSAENSVTVSVTK